MSTIGCGSDLLTVGSTNPVLCQCGSTLLPFSGCPSCFESSCKSCVAESPNGCRYCSSVVHQWIPQPRCDRIMLNLALPCGRGGGLCQQTMIGPEERKQWVYQLKLFTRRRIYSFKRLGTIKTAHFLNIVICAKPIKCLMSSQSWKTTFSLRIKSEM